MNARRHRWCAWFIMGVLLASTSGCGYLLYPDRRTEPLSDRKDATVIVFDCLWLLVGVIPGVVALVVDGVNDTWYYTDAELESRQNRASLDVPRGTDLAIHLHGQAPEDARVTLALRDAAGTDLGSVAMTSDPAGGPDMLRLSVPADLTASEATLVLAVNGDTQIAWDLHIVD